MCYNLKLLKLKYVRGPYFKKDIRDVASTVDFLTADPADSLMVSIDGTSTKEELLKVSRRFPGQRKDYQKMKILKMVPQFWESDGTHKKLPIWGG